MMNNQDLLPGKSHEAKVKETIRAMDSVVIQDAAPTASPAVPNGPGVPYNADGWKLYIDRTLHGWWRRQDAEGVTYYQPKEITALTFRDMPSLKAELEHRIGSAGITSNFGIDLSKIIPADGKITGTAVGTEACPDGKCPQPHKPTAWPSDTIIVGLIIAVALVLAAIVHRRRAA